MAETPRNKGTVLAGTTDGLGGYIVSPPSNNQPPTLAELGISKRESSEARLGELIKVEQAAGRLASPGANQYSKSGHDSDVITKNLSDYGLTAKDSSRAQQLAEHPEKQETPTT